jgi:3-oxoacyl-[acyl-carrier-protein] synthase-1
VGTQAPVVVGVGMMTSVGLTTKETAASVRSGVMRFAESRLLDKTSLPFTLAVVPDDALPPLTGALESEFLTSRERRMLRLATQPLRECLAPVAADGHLPRLPLCLALPEDETLVPLDRARFLQRLALQAGGGIDVSRSDASPAGRAGGLLALGQAVAAIESGAADLVVAGAVDSYRDPYVLGILDVRARVKSSANLDGFIPGEGAAFILLASPHAAAARGLAPLARLSRVAAGFEAGYLGSPEPYRGDGLATTVAQLVALTAVEEPLQEVYSSMNGESHWAKEWGVTYIRNKALFRPDYGMHHPADTLGDTGAAAGPVMVGLAAFGIIGSYRRSPTLVYGSSDRGPRAAVVVSTATH